MYQSGVGLEPCVGSEADNRGRRSAEYGFYLTGKYMVVSRQAQPMAV